MKLSEYTYDQYYAFWHDICGHTCYWLSSTGYTGNHVPLMRAGEFNEAKSRIERLLREQQTIDNPNELEAMCWEIIGMKIPLLLAGRKID